MAVAPEHQVDHGSPLEAMQQKDFALRSEAPNFFASAGKLEHAAPEHKADHGSPLEALQQKGFALRSEVPEFLLSAGVAQAAPWQKTRSMRRMLRRHTASWRILWNLQVSL